MFRKPLISPRLVAIIDSDNVKDVAMNILDQSISSCLDHSRFSAHDK